jgi:hypothetical protein
MLAFAWLGHSTESWTVKDCLPRRVEKAQEHKISTLVELTPLRANSAIGRVLELFAGAAATECGAGDSDAQRTHGQFQFAEAS